MRFGRGRVRALLAGSVLVAGLQTTAGMLPAAQADEISDLQWVARVAGEGPGEAYGAAVRDDGSSVVVGSMGSVGDFGSGVTHGTSGSPWAAFVASYAADGTTEWAHKITGRNWDHIFDVTVDDEGNAYITGDSSGSPTTFSGGGDTPSFAGWGVMVAKLSRSGQVLWAKNVLDGGITDAGRGIGVDAAGNIYVAGYYQSNEERTAVVAGGPTLPGLGASGTDFNAFVLSLTPDGSYRWVRALHGNAFQIAYGLAVDDAGNSFVTGQLQSELKLDGTTVLSGNQDPYVASFDADGGLRWLRRDGSIGACCEHGYEIDVTPDGTSVAVAGQVFGTSQFGSTTLPDTGVNAYVARYDGDDGDLVWVKRLASANSNGNGVAIDPAGNIAVSGWTIGPITVASGVDVPGRGDVDSFVASYTATGDLRWASVDGGVGDDRSWGLASDAVGNVLVVGHFSQLGASFGSGAQAVTVPGSNHNDAFAARYGAVPLVVVTDTDSDSIPDDDDNCVDDVNADQADTDGDGAGDPCDAFPHDADNDADGDGVGGDVDNCPGDANDQADTDGDGAGDACDADDDGDGTLDGQDEFPLDPLRDGDENNDGTPDTDPPVTADQCKNGGWATFNNPTFRNQGDCVSYVATGGRNGARR